MNKEYTLQLNDALKGGLCESTVIQLIKITISHIGHEVTWEDFEDYFASKIPEDDEIFENLHSLIFSHFESLEKSEESIDTDLVKLSFESPQVVQAFYAFTQHSFPIINDEYPKLDNQEIILTADQLFFCRRGAKLKTGELPSDFLSDYFLKTLRADEYDFSDKFIKSLFPKADGSRYLQNLRPRNREPYTISGDGSIISRAERTALSKPKNDGYTQIQSHTLLDTKALTPVFGFNKDRNPKLYGILTHQQDLIISRLLLNDGGTVFRPFDAQEPLIGEEKSSRFRNNSSITLFHHREIKKFKVENIKARKRKENTNEVLARMKFNIYRSLICICSDTVSSKFLAVDFSKELLERFSDYAKENRITLNPKFRFSILFYLKTTNSIKDTKAQPKHKIFKLTRKMHKALQTLALETHTNLLKDSYITLQNYELFLGLNTVSPDILLRLDSKGVPLALKMLQQGYTRMLLRLIRSGRARKTDQESEPLSEIVFNALIAANVFQKNDPLISQLIMAEAFTLADKIIAATESDKNLLAIKRADGGTLMLIEHIASTGNPRHFNFMGLDETLLHAARKNHWVSIRLCLKEYPQIRDETIDALISDVLKWNNTKDPDIIFLLKLKQKNIYFSSLAYAVLYNVNYLDEFFEIENKRQDEYSSVRLNLAVDLAHAQNNNPAIAFFEAKKITADLISQMPPLISPCHYIFEAFFANLPSVVEYRLKRLEKQYSLEFLKTRNLISKLVLLSDFFELSLLEFNKQIGISHQNYITPFFSCLVTLCLKHKDLRLIDHFKEIFVEKLKVKTISIEEIIIDISLSLLSPNNAELIEKMITLSPEKDLWKNKISKKFNDILHHGDRRIKSTCVFYLLLALQRLGDTSVFDKKLIIKAFKHAARSQSITLTTMILKDLPLTDSLKEKCLYIAMHTTHSLYFNYLVTHFDLIIRKELLTSTHRDLHYYKYVTLLVEIQKEQYKDQFSPWDFFNIWINYSPRFHNRGPTDFRVLVINLLPAHIIRHFTLISLVLLYKQAYEIIKFQGDWPNIQRLLNSDLCSKDSLITNTEYKNYKPDLKNFYEAVLNILDQYFIQLKPIPDESTVNETYRSVKDILHRNKPIEINTLFFQSKFTGQWNCESYHYLNDIDELIKQKQNNTLDIHSINPSKEIKEDFPHQRLH